jgi:hypothetical protein
MIKYSEEMILHSHSGYCMPFEEPEGRECGGDVVLWQSKASQDRKAVLS